MMELGTHYEREDLGGGRFRQTTHLRPIAFLRNGGMHRIANALGNSGDPQLPIGVDELVQFRVRDRLAGNAPLLHFGKGQSHVRLTPLDTANVNGQVAGNTILFPGARPGADLRLIIGGHRLETEWLLGAGHPASFAWRIDEHGGGFDPAKLAWPEFRMLQPLLRDPAGGLDIPLTWVVTQQGGRYILTVTLPAGNFAGWVLDPTLVLQPGAADGLDTYTNRAAPDTNNGTATSIATNGNAASMAIGLLKFDLSSLASATIVSAVLSLYNVSGPGGNRIFTLNSILAANAAWTEGGATWNYAVASTTRWAGDAAGDGGADAGCSVSGTDWNASALGTFTVLAGAAADTEHPCTLSASQVQAWLTGNNGLVLRIGGTNSLSFRSSDHATAANRPKLTLEYTLPATAGRRIFTAVYPGIFG